MWNPVSIRGCNEPACAPRAIGRGAGCAFSAGCAVLYVWGIINCYSEQHWFCLWLQWCGRSVALLHWFTLELWLAAMCFSLVWIISGYGVWQGCQGHVGRVRQRERQRERERERDRQRQRQTDRERERERERERKKERKGETERQRKRKRWRQMVVPNWIPVTDKTETGGSHLCSTCLLDS